MSEENLQKFVREKLSQSTNDVFSIKYDGQKLWVKKAKKSGSNILQHLAFAIFKNPLLIPSKKQSPKDSIINESSRIKEIYEKYSHVPNVMLVDDEFMVMGDTGRDLRSFLGSLTDKEHIKTILLNALDVLIRLHLLGYFHGGSQIKNLTIKNEKICMIDFEEKFENAPLEELQFRDLFLFLISISKLNYGIDCKNLIDIYVQKTSKDDIYQKFSNLIKSASFLIKILDNKTILKKMDKDTKSVYRLLKQI